MPKTGWELDRHTKVVALRRQLAVTESGLAGSASTRKAVIGGTVDRLQRAETAAKHQVANNSKTKFAADFRVFVGMI